MEIDLVAYSTWDVFYAYCVSCCEHCDTSEILLVLNVPEDQMYIRDALVETGCSLGTLRHSHVLFLCSLFTF